MRYGILPNGMKYAILKNETPQDAASVRLAFDFGSIAESEDELGLAHFIEHMAFNGSTNIPEGEMVKILEREGLAFGADTNASTGFDVTQYKLDLPRADDDLLDTALMIMRETASNLTIDPEAVNRERGVLLSEMRTRDSFQLRRIKDYFGFAGPDTPFAQRLPIGTAQVLQNASAAQLRSLYERYYRPQNATLVLVGDFDPAMVERKVRERFADWQAVGSAGAALDRGRVDLARPTQAGVFVDPAVPNIVTIDRFAPYAQRPTTRDEYARSLKLNIAGRMLNRRFQKIINQDGSPLIGASVDTSTFLRAADQASVTAVAKDGEWREAVRIAEQELRRALQYGFTEAELAEQMANIERDVVSAAEQAGTRRSNVLAEAIVATVAEEDLFVTPQTALDLFREIQPQLTTAEIAATFAQAFDGSAPLIHVSSKTPIDGGADTVLAAYRASSEVAVAPPAQEAVAAFAYDDFGTPGQIVSDTLIEDLGIRTIRFDNNVMLNLKPTDFEEGRLRYSIEVGGGNLALPAEAPGLALYMSQLFGVGGLGQHSTDELSAILAGRDVSGGLAVGADAFTAAGTTKMRDFAMQMAVSAAFLTDPGYRPEMQSQWNALVPLIDTQLDATPQAVAARELDRILHDGDPRFGIPSGEILMARNAAEMKAALAVPFADAPIEIAVVGEFDADAVIAAVARTFGALPERRSTPADYSAARQTRFPADRAPVTLYHAGKPDQALAVAAWPTRDDEDAREDAVLSMLAQAMQLEVLDEVRERLGASYSPNISSSTSSIYPDYGTLTASVVVAPDQAEAVYDAITRIAAQLRDAPVDADLLERARKPIMERIRQSLRENGFWMSVADNAQGKADRLDRVRTREQRYASVTAEEILAAARRYLDPAGMLRVTVLHESMASQ